MHTPAYLCSHSISFVDLGQTIFRSGFLWFETNICFCNRSKMTTLLQVAYLSAAILLSVALGQIDGDHVGDGNSSRCYDDATTIHQFTPINIDGQEVTLSDYNGRVVLIVNVASFCGFTKQYHGLTKLKKLDALKDHFEILAFPCNQFGYQEPGADKREIMYSLKYVRPGYDYTPNFLMFAKIEVNGENESDLFTHLKASCPPVKLEIGDPSDRFWSPFRNNDITWNFNKFLIDKSGVPYKRYDSAVEPKDILHDIKELLEEDK